MEWGNLSKDVKALYSTVGDKVMELTERVHRLMEDTGFSEVDCENFKAEEEEWR